MTWFYLSEFWDQITEVFSTTSENLVSYPVAFFQNIGNAVAGALGNIFDTFFHTFSDLTLFFSWSGEMLGKILYKLGSPFVYIFNFLKNAFSIGFSTPDTPDLTYTFSTSTLAVFDSIPYWTTMTTILGVAFTLFVGIAIFKLFTKI